jgi:hypothetical protein
MPFCTRCQRSFATAEASPRCPSCLRITTVVADAPGARPARRPPPLLLVVGVATWASALAAARFFADRGTTVAARWEAGTLGVLAFAGFVASAVGAWRWWRARR